MSAQENALTVRDVHGRDPEKSFSNGTTCFGDIVLAVLLNQGDQTLLQA